LVLLHRFLKRLKLAWLDRTFFVKCLCRRDIDLWRGKLSEQIGGRLFIPNKIFESGDAMRLEPYLFFDGQCDEAIEFYKRAVGARVQMVMRNKECPEPSAKLAPEMMDKVMHASLRVGESLLMLSDGHCAGKPNFSGFSLSLTVSSDAEADRVFTALSDGGKVGMPLAKTFFSPRFGMVTDRFGVGWMVLVQA
jgi:PhnB protein